MMTEVTYELSLASVTIALETRQVGAGGGGPGGHLISYL